MDKLSRPNNLAKLRKKYQGEMPELSDSQFIFCLLHPPPTALDKYGFAPKQKDPFALHGYEDSGSFPFLKRAVKTLHIKTSN